MVIFFIKIKQQAKCLLFFVLDLIFPRDCVCCHREGFYLCQDCLPRLNFLAYQDYQNLDLSCDKILAAAHYHQPEIAELIKICKYDFSREAGHDLAKILIYWLNLNYNQTLLNNLSNFIIMPVPLNNKRLRWRGFNQADVIAQDLAKHFNFNYDNKNLIRHKYTKPQVSLAHSERQVNLINSFAWRGDSLINKNILLIDDVATTGSTLSECAKALKTAGANRVWALVIAK